MMISVEMLRAGAKRLLSTSRLRSTSPSFFVPDSSHRPHSGTRIAHIGIAVRHLDELRSFFRDVLGMPDVPLADADGAHIAGLAAGDSLVELLEARTDDSPIGKFIAKRGPGVHHICFVVDDLDSTLERCRRAGIRLIDQTPRRGAEGKRIAFLHPTSTGGVLVELTEP
jgi:methylmalonyl-CoA/ethylmalonyl-CoA epimerase